MAKSDPKMVLLPCCGVMMAFESIERYDRKTHMTGRFCPFDGTPLDTLALSHFHGPDVVRFGPIVERFEKEMKKAGASEG